MSGHDAAEQATHDLDRRGFTDHFVLREDAIKDLDPKAHNAGLVERLVHGVEDHLSEEQNYFAQYAEEVRAGKDVIAVAAEGDAKIDSAASILADHGAANIRYFGTLAVKDLTPESNPSTRSQESPEARNWSNV